MEVPALDVGSEGGEAAPGEGALSLFGAVGSMAGKAVLVSLWSGIAFSTQRCLVLSSEAEGSSVPQHGPGHGFWLQSLKCWFSRPPCNSVSCSTCFLVSPFTPYSSESQILLLATAYLSSYRKGNFLLYSQIYL